MELRSLTKLKSENGTLNVSLKIKKFRVNTSVFAFNTRAYCIEHESEHFCSIPGPMIECQPGDTLHVSLINDLAPDNSLVQLNKLHSPNTSNLHTHGLHVDPAIDNVFIKIFGGGDSHTYHYQIPIDHAPGLHWYHAHLHGSTALQISGGLLGPIQILPIDDKHTPQALQAMEKETLVFMHMILDPTSTSSQSFFRLSEDTNSTLPIDPEYFGDESTKSAWLVNGQYQPETSLSPGEWKEFDLLSGSINLILELEIRTKVGFQQGELACEVALLGMDGVYFDRARYGDSVDHLTMVGASRAMIGVMCPNPGMYYFQTTGYPGTGEEGVKYSGIGATKLRFDQNLLTLHVVGDPVEMEKPGDLSAFQKPTYLQSLLDKPVSNENKWSMSVFQAGCCGSDSKASYWLGIGTDCTQTCFDDESCIKQYGESFTVWDFPSVKQGLCEYIPYPGSLSYNGSDLDLRTRSSSEGTEGYRYVTRLASVGELSMWGFGFHPMHVHLNHLQLKSFTPASVLMAGVEVGNYTSTLEEGIPLFGDATPVDDVAGWFGQAGDWRDTWPALPGVTVFRTAFYDYPGEIVVHCHVALHEDRGMMASILVLPADDDNDVVLDTIDPVLDKLTTTPTVSPTEVLGSFRSTLGGGRLDWADATPTVNGVEVFVILGFGVLMLLIRALVKCSKVSSVISVDTPFGGSGSLRSQYEELS